LRSNWVHSHTPLHGRFLPRCVATRPSAESDVSICVCRKRAYRLTFDRLGFRMAWRTVWKPFAGSPLIMVSVSNSGHGPSQTEFTFLLSRLGWPPTGDHTSNGRE
jgi:hypothetical protein